MLSNGNVITNLNDKINFRRQLVVYSLLFLIAAIGVYFWFLVCDRTMIINRGGNNDGFAQQYMVYAKIKHMFQELLAGNSLGYWSWDIGLGGDYFYYFKSRLLNPFTYLVIIFPEQYLDLGYGIMVVLKQYCTGIAFLFFAKEVRLNANQAITGAICYAFSGWMIMETLNEPGFTNAAVLLPLLIMGIEKVLSNKSPVLFIIVVFWFISVTTTFAYIAGIVSVAYYVIRYFKYNKKKGSMAFIKSLMLYFTYGVCGILLASFVLITYVMSILGTSTESAAVTYDLYSIKQYLTIFAGFFRLRVTTTPCTYYYLPCICIAMIPHIITRTKKSTAAVITFALLLLSLLPITGSVFNGFGYSVGRWYFVLIFFWVWASMECLNKDMLMNAKKIVISIIWMLFLAFWNIVICYKWLRIIDDNGMLCAAFGVFFTCVILVGLLIANHINYERKILKIKVGTLLNLMVLVVLGGSIIMTGWMKFYPGIQENVFEYMASGEAQAALNSSTQRVGPEIHSEDESFYRIDNADGYTNPEYLSASVNENIYFGNRSIYSYFSILDSDWLRFHGTMGNNSGYSTRTCVMSNDNRPGLDLLLGVKYFLGNNDQKEYDTTQYAGYGFEPYDNISGVDVLKNKYDIGIGTAYQQYITESELEKYTYLEREQIMLQAAVIADNEAEKLAGIKKSDARNLETNIIDCDYRIENIDNIDLKDGEITVYGGGGTFDLDLDEVKNSHVIVSFKNLRREPNSYETIKDLSYEEITRKGVARKISSASYRDTESISINASAGGITKTALYRHGGSTGIAGISDFNINLGYYDSFSGKLHIRLGTVGYYTYDEIKVYAMPMDIYDKYAAELDANSMKVETVANDYIKGEIDAKKDSIMYMSVFDDPGWSVYVDGEQCEKINSVNIAFSGVIISDGKHDIELRYKPTWLLPGTIGTIIGIILFVGVLVLRKKSRKERMLEE